MALTGGLGLTGFTSLFSFGAQHTTAVNLGITQGVIPAFVTLFGLLVFGTPVGKLQFFGLLLSLCGVVALITGGHIVLLLMVQFNLDELRMIAACFCYAFYVLHLGKRPNITPIIMVAYFSFSALLSLTVFSIGEYAAGQLLLPVFAAFMAIGLLSERMHGYHVEVLLMVLAGIALAEKHKVSVPAG